MLVNKTNIYLGQLICPVKGRELKIFKFSKKSAERHISVQNNMKGFSFMKH